ncbi:MAG: hypothetical protein R3220_08630 [Balneolaceae bacterium]|nr:hypothetical protein [Balneolaceae bacterium]
MAKTVEIIGPSGSGKSSVYSSLRSRWKEGDNWVTYDDMHRSAKKMRKRYLRKAVRIITDMLPIGRQSENNTLVNGEWDFIDYTDRIFLDDSNSEFKKAIFDLIEEHNRKWYDGSDKRFVTIYMMMWSIAHIDRVLTAKNDDRFCILKQGEGFVSRIMHLNSPSFDEAALQKYLEHIIYPRKLIFLDVHADVILKRIKNRDRTATLHKGMDEETIRRYTQKTIKFFEIAMDSARQEGVEVHRVDASKSLAETVDEIIEVF